MSDKELQAGSAVTEPVEVVNEKSEIAADEPEIENEDDQNGDEAPEAEDNKKNRKAAPEKEKKVELTRSTLRGFAGNLQNVHRVCSQFSQMVKRFNKEFPDQNEISKEDQKTLVDFIENQFLVCHVLSVIGKKLIDALPEESKSKNKTATSTNPKKTEAKSAIEKIVTPKTKKRSVEDNQLSLMFDLEGDAQ